MTPTEAVALTRYLRAHFPSQPIDEYTTEALAETLAPYAAEDCRAAVYNIAESGAEWCAPTAVKAEVKRIRSLRIKAAGDLCPPSGLSELEERRWLGWARRQIGDGVPVEQIQEALPSGPKRDVLALGTVRGVGDA